MYLGWIKHLLARRAFLWAFALILISQPPLSASIVHIDLKLHCVAGLLSRQTLLAQGILFRNIPCVLENALQLPCGSKLTNGFGLQRWTTGNYLVAVPDGNKPTEEPPFTLRAFLGCGRGASRFLKWSSASVAFFVLFPTRVHLLLCSSGLKVFVDLGHVLHDALPVGPVRVHHLAELLPDTHHAQAAPHSSPGPLQPPAPTPEPLTAIRTTAMIHWASAILISLHACYSLKDFFHLQSKISSLYNFI